MVHIAAKAKDFVDVYSQCYHLSTSECQWFGIAAWSPNVKELGELAQYLAGLKHSGSGGGGGGSSGGGGECVGNLLQIYNHVPFVCAGIVKAVLHVAAKIQVTTRHLQNLLHFKRP